MTEAQREQIRHGFMQLANTPAFVNFMEITVRDLEKSALLELYSNSALANPQIQAAYIGEARAYHDIFAQYEEVLEQRKQMVESTQPSNSS